MQLASLQMDYDFVVKSHRFLFPTKVLDSYSETRDIDRTKSVEKGRQLIYGAYNFSS